MANDTITLTEMEGAKIAGLLNFMEADLPKIFWGFELNEIAQSIGD